MLTLDRAFGRVVTAVHRFRPKQPDETFFAFAMDAGLLCLASEEGVARVLATYRANVEAERVEVDANALPEWFVEQERSMFELMREPDDTFETYLVRAVARQHKQVARDRAQGNPYDAPEKKAALRFQTGDWPYQGFARLEDLKLDDPTPALPSVGAGECTMPELIRVLREHQAFVFAPLKCSTDFRIFHARHTY